jgi:hypothetical protein
MEMQTEMQREVERLRQQVKENKRLIREATLRWEDGQGALDAAVAAEQAARATMGSSKPQTS